MEVLHQTPTLSFMDSSKMSDIPFSQKGVSKPILPALPPISSLDANSRFYNAWMNSNASLAKPIPPRPTAAVTSITSTPLQFQSPPLPNPFSPQNQRTTSTTSASLATLPSTSFFNTFQLDRQLPTTDSSAGHQTFHPLEMNTTNSKQQQQQQQQQQQSQIRHEMEDEEEKERQQKKTRNKAIARSKPQPFNVRYKELIEYKKIFGHTNVSRGDGPQWKSLADWVHNQRSTRKYGKLAPERIRKLDKLGFVWEVRPSFKTWKTASASPSPSSSPVLHSSSLSALLDDQPKENSGFPIQDGGGRKRSQSFPSAFSNQPNLMLLDSDSDTHSNSGSSSESEHENELLSSINEKGNPVRLPSLSSISNNRQLPQFPKSFGIQEYPTSGMTTIPRERTN